MSKDRSIKGLVDSILELIDLVAQYARQQAQQVVDESIVKPIQKAGRIAGLFIFAFTAFAIALLFIVVGVFIAFANLVGYSLAFIIIGVVLVINGAIALSQMKR